MSRSKAATAAYERESFRERQEAGMETRPLPQPCFSLDQLVRSPFLHSVVAYEISKNVCLDQIDDRS